MATQTAQPRDFYEVQDALISVSKVSVQYGEQSGTTALHDISFQIFPGEFLCVMGPSGCGKSTLLKILAGFLSPTSGSATLDEQEIHGPDWHRGVVFQQPSLFPWLSVRENVAFGPKMRGIKNEKVQADADKYLELVGLADAADRKVFELSGGMQQRVSIARALINSPEILLMDEPFGALDALTRSQMQALVRRIWWNTGKTIFFITHDVDEALQLGTRVLVLSKHPGTLLADIPVHFSRALVEQGDNQVCFSNEFYRQRTKILALISGPVKKNEEVVSI